MTAEEIRDAQKQQNYTLCDAIRSSNIEAIGLAAFALVEIAAQLAELNRNLKNLDPEEQRMQRIWGKRQ
jgi:hypothetical protein